MRLPNYYLWALLTVLVFGFCAPVAAQRSDGSFREFGRTLVPTPEELFRSLSAFGTDDVPGANSRLPVKSSVLKQLEKSGRELLSQMSPEQKKNAREFADKFLAENGLQSKEGRALMEQLGIPPELQTDLAEQVKGWDKQDRKRFSSLAELFSQRQPGPAGSSANKSGENSATIRSSQSNIATNAPKANSDSSVNLGEYLKNAAERLGSEDQQKVAKSAFKNILDGAKDTLTGSSSSSPRPQERLTSRFDRLLVKAAEKSLEAKSNGPDNLDLPDSVESALERVFGKVRDSLKKKKKRFEDAIPPENSPIRGQGNGELTPSNVNASNRSAGGPNPSNTFTNRGNRLMDGVGDLPKIDPSRLLLVMFVIGLCALAGYVSWQVWGNQSAKGAQRGLRRRRLPARIRSPKDLVEAVDQIIIRKFGTDARWWNAKHARDVLCSNAPHFNAPISDLINGYVRARYSHEDPSLSADVQQRYKATLKELSNLRFENDTTDDIAPRDEG